MDLMLSTLDYVLLVTGLLGILYWYGTRPHRRFKKTCVPYMNPAPILGNIWRNLFGLEAQLYCYGPAYTNFPQARFSGLFEVLKPIVMIRDPELISQVAVKDFNHFTDHDFFLDEGCDPLFGNLLFSMKGGTWRDMRSTLSPAFTGSKMRAMYPLVSDCAQQMVEYFRKETTQGAKIVDMKKLFTKYGNDVIANAGFGLKVNTFEDPDNEFYKQANIVTTVIKVETVVKFLGFNLIPSVMKALGITFLATNTINYFRQLVHGTMAMREKEGIIRPDMIHLLMQARKGTLRHENTDEEKDTGFATITESEVGRAQTSKRVWTDDELTAQVVVFILAGFDTVSTALSYTSFELAMNVDVQTKLQAEIDEVRQELNGETPGYEIINNMKYLDMVLSESLRKWPPVTMVDRVCTKPYTIEDYQGNKHTIKKGEGILLPIYHIQRDEKYYTDPDKFDVGRFSDENKDNIKPYTYMPFGAGPRSCVGSRLALMEIKALLYHMLSLYDLRTCYKTENPPILAKNEFDLATANGIWLEISPRKLVR